MKFVFDVMQTLALILAPVGLLIVYWRQKKYMTETASRELRARLAASYANYHATILSNEHTIALSHALIWKKYTERQAAQIHYLAFMLNTLDLEWHFVEKHGHSRSSFDQTLDALMGRFASNITDENRVIFDQFHEIYRDFPKEFREAVHLVMARHLPNAARIRNGPVTIYPANMRKTMLERLGKAGVVPSADS